MKSGGTSRLLSISPILPLPQRGNKERRKQRMSLRLNKFLQPTISHHRYSSHWSPDNRKSLFRLVNAIPLHLLIVDKIRHRLFGLVSCYRFFMQVGDEWNTANYLSLPWKVQWRRIPRHDTPLRFYKRKMLFYYILENRFKIFCKRQKVL